MTSVSELRQGAWYSSRLGAGLATAVVLAGLALVLFVNLRVEPVGRSSEARCVSVVREMIGSGDWLVPHLGRVVRLQKPPLFYWAGAATATLLGDAGPIAVRLPSAVAAIALVALVMRWGGSITGPGTGLAAGAALAAMLQLTVSGRRGDAEMLLALLCVASLVVFDRLHATRRRELLPLFGILTGLAFLTKATAVILVVGLPILVFLAMAGELGRLRNPRVLGTGALALAIGLSWYMAILALVPGALEILLQILLLPLGAASQHTGNAGHLRPLWWYFSILPVRAAPASLLLPVVVWRLWTTGLYRADPRLRFASLTFLVPFVAFSLLPEKQRHYTLVMLPGLALLCAEAVGALVPRARAWLARGVGAPLALAGLVGTGLLALFFVWIEGLPLLGVTTGAACLGALFALALAAALRGRAAGFACAWLPAFLLALTLQRSVVEVRVEQLTAAGLGGSLSLDEKERLYRVAREQPWFIEVFQLAHGSGGDD